MEAPNNNRRKKVLQKEFEIFIIFSLGAIIGAGMPISTRVYFTYHFEKIIK